MADSLSKYLLDHDLISYYVDKETATEIDGSSSSVSEEKIVLRELTMDLEENIYIDGKLNNDLVNYDHTKYFDFKFGFEDIQFKDEAERDEKLIIIAKKVAEVNIQTQENRSWTTKDGNVTKKQYSYKTDLEGAIISIHINAEGHSHLHILDKKNKRYGYKFNLLRREIIGIVRQVELTSSINTNFNPDDKSEYRILHDRLTNLSWIVKKHEEAKYILNHFKKENYRSEKCVNLDNVEEKLNRYVKLGGSYDFARKLKASLKEKLNKDINVKIPQEYEEAAEILAAKSTGDIIKIMAEKIKKGDKLSERFKEEIEKIKSMGGNRTLAEGMIELYKNRGFYFNANDEKVFDNDKIDKITEVYINVFENNSKDIVINELREILNKRLILNEKQMSEAGIGRDEKGNIKYKNLTLSFNEVVGKSKGEYFYENTYKYFTDKINWGKFIEFIEKYKFENKNKAEVINDFVKSLMEEIRISSVENGFQINDKWFDSIIEKYKNSVLFNNNFEIYLKLLENSNKTIEENKKAEETIIEEESSTDNISDLINRLFNGEINIDIENKSKEQLIKRTVKATMIEIAEPSKFAERLRTTENTNEFISVIEKKINEIGKVESGNGLIEGIVKVLYQIVANIFKEVNKTFEKVLVVAKKASYELLHRETEDSSDENIDLYQEKNEKSLRNVNILTGKNIDNVQNLFPNEFKKIENDNNDLIPTDFREEKLNQTKNVEYGFYDYYTEIEKHFEKHNKEIKFKGDENNERE